MGGEGVDHVRLGPLALSQGVRERWVFGGPIRSLSILFRPEAGVLLRRDVRRAGRPPDLCESYNWMRLTRGGGRQPRAPRHGD
jgi:hypothetical protein